MLTNRALRLFRQGKPALGLGVGLGAPLAAETVALAGFPLVLVDNQHGAWDDQGSMLAFRSTCLGGATPFIRVQRNDYYAIGRALDRGALGVVVPMVNSVAEAREAARAMRYPPRGGRSMGPFGTAFMGTDYVQCANDEVFLAVQIESKEAAEHAEEILAVDGVDGCWVGPSDLGLSMGVDLATAEGKRAHEATILHVLDACHKTGKVPGIAGTPITAPGWLAHGFLFVTLGSDGSLLASAAQATLKALQP